MLLDISWSSARSSKLHRLRSMKVPVLIAVASLNLLLVPGVVWPRPEQGRCGSTIQRMESLFLRLDADGNGRLERQELNGRPALLRQLKRKAGRNFLLLEDVRSRQDTVRGQRSDEPVSLGRSQFDRRSTERKLQDFPGSRSISMALIGMVMAM
ncbi:MAG: hypothetical protein CM15mP77_1360 [Synechococcus sp.]|nr:MAG: hypothetical protein CM15mP77_1360 [Synechococcus sp.]